MTSRTERLALDLASTRELNEKEVVRLGSIIENKVINLMMNFRQFVSCCATFNKDFQWLIIMFVIIQDSKLYVLTKRQPSFQKAHRWWQTDSLKENHSVV